MTALATVMTESKIILSYLSHKQEKLTVASTKGFLQLLEQNQKILLITASEDNINN